MAHRFLSTTLTADVLRAQQAAYGRARPVPPADETDELGAAEELFIGRRDSFYLASVNSDGWPYIQHRGGPRGFLKVLDPHTLAFADLSGNRQLLTTGNVAANDRVALFLMDYARRERLKVIGHAEVLPIADHPELAAALAPAGVAAPAVERVFRIRVIGFDWNCPKHIVPRFTVEEVEKIGAPLRERLAAAEAELQALRSRAPSA